MRCVYSLIGMFCCIQAALALPISVQHTQTQLEHLDSKIHALKQHLETVQGQQGNLEQTLSVTEKQIGNVVQRLNQTRQTLQHQQALIQALIIQSKTLSSQLVQQQQALAQHVQIRYMMGDVQPLKSVLNTEAPILLDRLFVYSQYVIQARKQLIQSIDNTQMELAKNKLKLEQEVKAQEALRHRLQQEQAELAAHQNKNMTVMKGLTQTLKTEAERLKEYEQNKQALSALLKRLSAQSEREEAARPPTKSISRFAAQPVAQAIDVKNWHQGLFFAAKEGASVNAVQAGKVVFSDWLKGYGLLLILDHGHGMMTLYGYNQALFKRQGEQVRAMERVATVGHSGGRREDGLYFEVRRFGKVIAAQRWLRLARK